jgi:ABC-2 type transport system permease protein
VLGVGTYIFDIPIRGNLGLIFVSTLLYVMSTLGAGLLISTVSRTQQQSFLAAFLFILPAVFLSGALSPIRAMPQWLLVLTYVNPVRFYVETMRGLLLKGTDFAELHLQLGALFVFGSGTIIGAVLRFEKRTS